MSRRVIGYVVRAYKSDGLVDQFEFKGTDLQTLIAVQDKVNELEPQVGGEINAVTQSALYADQLPPPQPRTQAPRHREIAS